MQELGEILRRRTQHALLLKVLDPSLWFLVEPVSGPPIHKTRCRITSIKRELQKLRKRKELIVQVDALLNDFFLLLEDLELLWVVRPRHLGAVAADARRGRGVQRVDAPIAVNGLWGLVLSALLL